jgi:hypothetical protein
MVDVVPPEEPVEVARPGLDPAAGQLLAEAADAMNAHGTIDDGLLRFDAHSGVFKCVHLEERRLRRSSAIVERRAWILRGRVTPSASQAGRLVIRELTIEALDALDCGIGVDETVLRSIRTGELVACLSRRLLRIDDTTRSAYAAVTGREPQWAAPQLRSKGRGRSPERDDYLRRLAEAAIQEGGRSGFRRRLAERFTDRGGHPKPEGTIREDLRAAREAGWLAPSRRGERSAQPGARLHAKP